MTDAAVFAWLASHQLIAYTVFLLVIGTIAGLVRERTPDEEARFKADSPRMFAIVKLAQTYGIDSRRVVAFAMSVVTGNLARAMHVSSGTTMRPPPEYKPKDDAR